MTKRLALKTEHLTELTSDELRLAAGAAGGDSFTGRVNCILSIQEPCVSTICLGTVIASLACAAR